MALKPIHIDGLAIVGAPFFGALAGAFSSDTAYLYVNASVVWWSRALCEASAVGLGAFVAWRNTGYAKHRAEQDDAAAGKKSITVDDKTVHSETQTPAKPLDATIKPPLTVQTADQQSQPEVAK